MIKSLRVQKFLDVAKITMSTYENHASNVANTNFIKYDR